MEVKLSKEQTKAFKALTTEEFAEVKRVLYGGQAGGGKSYLIAIYCWWMCNSYPGIRGYIARDAGIKKIKESILVTCFDVWDNLGYSYRYNDKDGFILFPNGSKIVLLDIFAYPSDPNFVSLGSTEYTFGCIEEGVTASKKACEILMSRTRYKHDVYNLKPKQLITCNPDEGWIKEEIIVPHFEGRLRPDTLFVNATLSSNPNKAFVATYTDTLESMSDEYDKARLLSGDWFAMPRTGGEFYKMFTDGNTVKADDFTQLYESDEPLHISFDFNVRPYITLTVFQYYDEGYTKKLLQIDEFCLNSPLNNTTSLCKEFVKRYEEHTAGLFIYGDPSGKHEDTRTEAGHNDYTIIRRELKRFRPKLRIMTKAPSVSARGDFINDIFGHNVEGLKIKIGKNCVFSIKDYNHVKEAEDGKKAKTRMKDPATGVSYEPYGHTSDANDYLIIRIFEKEFNKYLKGGEEIQRYVGRRRPGSSRKY